MIYEKKLLTLLCFQDLKLNKILEKSQSYALWKIEFKKCIYKLTLHYDC